MDCYFSIIFYFIKCHLLLPESLFISLTGLKNVNGNYGIPLLYMYIDFSFFAPSKIERNGTVIRVHLIFTLLSPPVSADQGVVCINQNIISCQMVIAVGNLIGTERSTLVHICICQSYNLSIFHVYLTNLV